ncbi:MAG TPA: polyprenyl synthetase family protein, partial [Actinomycetota bacterium]|nr:polyprenyl synthetase family protein [Actinomycetota bacterium]
METVRSRIDLHLQSTLDETRTRFAADHSQGIVDEVARAVTAGGSRIRPLLCCCGYAACNGEGGPLDERILRAASSIELLHTFAILHDDVMDGSPVRRGHPSTFVRVAEERRALGLKADADRYGLSVAVLAGDLALVLSDQLLADSGFAADRLAAAAAPVTRMRLDAIAGQYLDLTLSGRGVTDPNVTARIARLKTGSYSVEGPLLVGAALAGAE